MNWDQYFINIAEAVALRSKDPRTKVGAIIVDENNRIISTGYNGFPISMEDDPNIWLDETKHCFVIHAEMNAVIQAPPNKGVKIYSTLQPCCECLKVIAAAKITEIYFRDFLPRNKDESFGRAWTMGLNLHQVI